MKTKTNELIGPALDWAVAESEGNVRLQYDSREGLIICNILGWIPYRPSVAWAQGGPIIEREMIDLRKIYNNGLPNANPYDCWKAEIIFRDGKLVAGDLFAYGPTPLVAALRCFVASRLGDEVDVPKELLS